MARRLRPSPESDADQVTVQVAGRAALPVRAIPFLTCWHISPDELASQLARMQALPFAKLRNTDAYHLVNGKPVRVRDAEWRQIVSRLEALEARIRRETPHEQPSQDPEGYARWCRESVPELPSGVFVWRDEFERDFANDWDRVLRDPPGSPDQVLANAPMALRDQRRLVFEGFEDGSTAIVGNTTREADPERDEPEAERPKKWTTERIAEARAMRDRLKRDGKRDYMKRTADHFAVTPSFLRRLMKPEMGDSAVDRLSRFPFPDRKKRHNP